MNWFSDAIKAGGNCGIGNKCDDGGKNKSGFAKGRLKPCCETPATLQVTHHKLTPSVLLSDAERTSIHAAKSSHPESEGVWRGALRYIANNADKK